MIALPNQRTSMAFAITFLAAVSWANAHDLWLIPSAAAVPNRAVRVFAHVGEEFPISVLAPDTKAFARRLLIRPDGTGGTLNAVDKQALAGVLQFTPDKPGIYIAAIETTPKIIALDADKFNEYLVSDGLPHIYRLRFAEKSLNQPARERYRKSPKALVKVADGGGPFDKIVGLPLEIVPLSDPFARKIGDTLKVRALFNGNALADANLGWDLPNDGEPPSGTVRTDANGEARIPIAQTGLMTIRLTHMTRPKAKDYDWESFWTTLTFRIP